MKQIFCKTIACCAALLSFAACDKSDDFSVGEPGGDSIFLDFSSGAPASSRAEDTGVESRVDHLDVLIFDEAGTKKHYERIGTGASAGSTVALTAKRSGFDADAKYWVYLIANGSDAEKTAFEAEDFDRDRLLTMKREDPYLYLTGLSIPDYAPPQTFLMDGAAYAGGEQEPARPEAVVLNNGTKTDDTWLKVTLRRAAVKLVLKIDKGERIAFTSPEDGTGTASVGGYYLRNMPYTTSVVDGAGNDEVKVRTTMQTRNSLFEWSPEQIIVTAYVYANGWTNDSVIERETRWILDIPMTYDDPDPDPDREGEPAETKLYPHSYYQIPVCSGTELKRNTCYTVALTLNVPGGTSPSNPVELKDFRYEVVEPIDKTIPVGGEGERPMFLTLNRTEMEMHNIEIDDNTLQFASSSNVTPTVKAAYYYDKFGNRQSVSSAVLNRIKLTPDTGLNGGIKIESPVPENNTIRYIEIEVTNEDGVKARKVTIRQYPLEYITNIQGWYSYRSDFGGTTWLNYANPSQKRVSAYNYDSSNDKWQYSATSYANAVFFTSKVAEEVTGEDNPNRGKSTIAYYYYDKEKDKTLSTYNIWTETGNARMYHVQITASSDEYTIGRPRIKDGKTDPEVDNAQLVSPSFMIASQLGAVFTCNSTEMAASHCKEYVEVDKNGKVYDDWRLPTEAEIKIIINFQYKQNAAMDEVLAGKRYYSASGIVANPDGSGGTTTAIRCIRDAYDDPTADRTADPAAGDK